MVQKTKKRALYLLGIIGLGLFSGAITKHFDKSESVFSLINIAHADIPPSGGDGGGGDGDSDGGCDGGCSGCGDGSDAY